MSTRHIFDYYLSMSKTANSKAEKKRIGNALFEVAKVSSNSWRSILDRFLPGESDLALFPEGTWLIRLEFTLAKSFTSRAGKEFHHYEKRKVRTGVEEFEIQNSIVRDHTTGYPLVKPTTWKGHLRFVTNCEDLVSRRLFGSDNEAQAGRLHFFPTFFTQETSYEVLTPLSRDSRSPSSRGSISIEVMPENSKGTFCLLYVPWPKGVDWNVLQLAEDLQVTARAIKAMLLEYGFSAKKTAGWGVIQNKLRKGMLTVKGKRWLELDRYTENFQSAIKTYELKNVTDLDLVERLVSLLKKRKENGYV